MVVPHHPRPRPCDGTRGVVEEARAVRAWGMGARVERALTSISCRSEQATVLIPSLLLNSINISRLNRRVTRSRGPRTMLALVGTVRLSRSAIILR